MAAPKGNSFAKGNKGGGPKSGYQSSFAKTAIVMCDLGATDEEIAEALNISVRTLYSWKVIHQEFAAALKTGKHVADERVERSLYNRAVGYTFESEKVFCTNGEVTRVAIREHVPPDTAAAFIWLKNRRRVEWRDRHEHEHGRPGDFDKLSDAELSERIQETERALSLAARRASETGEPSAPIPSGRLN